jgi:hypothetical protein
MLTFLADDQHEALGVRKGIPESLTFLHPLQHHRNLRRHPSPRDRNFHFGRHEARYTGRWDRHKTPFGSRFLYYVSGTVPQFLKGITFYHDGRPCYG